MAAPDSDSDEDLVSYGTGLEPLEEGASLFGVQDSGTPTRITLCRALAGPGPRLPAAGAGNSDERRVPSLRLLTLRRAGRGTQRGKWQDHETSSSWESGVGGSGDAFTRRACVRSDLKPRKEPTGRRSGERAFQVAQQMQRL